MKGITEMDKGDKIFKGLVLLEKKMWNREDYDETDITLVSNALDFITDNIQDFKKYFKEG